MASSAPIGSTVSNLPENVVLSPGHLAIWQNHVWDQLSLEQLREVSRVCKVFHHSILQHHQKRIERAAPFMAKLINHFKVALPAQNHSPTLKALSKKAHIAFMASLSSDYLQMHRGSCILWSQLAERQHKCGLEWFQKAAKDAEWFTELLIPGDFFKSESPQGSFALYNLYREVDHAVNQWGQAFCENAKGGRWPKSLLQNFFRLCLREFDPQEIKTEDLIYKIQFFTFLWSDLSGVFSKLSPYEASLLRQLFIGEMFLRRVVIANEWINPVELTKDLLEELESLFCTVRSFLEQRDLNNPKKQIAENFASTIFKHVFKQDSQAFLDFIEQGDKMTIYNSAFLHRLNGMQNRNPV